MGLVTQGRGVCGIGLLSAVLLSSLGPRVVAPEIARAAPSQRSGQGGKVAMAPRTAKAAKVQCDSSRYDCVGGKPEDLDRHIRIIPRPTKGMDTGCLTRLRQAKVSFRMLSGVKGVTTPVEVLSDRLGGVRYQKAWSNKRRFILDCRMVEALVVLGRAIRAAGVAGIYYSSSWRYSVVKGQGRLSQHAYGLALDITAIEGAFGYASVLRDHQQGVSGCGERNKTPKGAAFRKLFCAIHGRRGFAQVFTPDTDRFHRDHWHVEQPAASLRLDSKPAPPRSVAPRSRR